MQCAYIVGARQDCSKSGVWFVKRLKVDFGETGDGSELWLDELGGNQMKCCEGNRWQGSGCSKGWVRVVGLVEVEGKESVSHRDLLGGLVVGGENMGGGGGWGWSVSSGISVQLERDSGILCGTGGIVRLAYIAVSKF